MATTPVGKLLLSVGQELGRSPDQMAPLIRRIVEDEWFDSIESLRSLSEDQWGKLGLPTRLVEKLKERVQIEEPPALIAVDTAPECVTEAPSTPITVVIEALLTEQAEVECVKTLERIVRNVLSDPTNLKYRQIKADNPKFQQHVSRWPSAVQLMAWLGFVTESNTFKCEKVFMGRFHDAHRELLRLVSILDPKFDSSVPASNQVNPAFNPFQASIINAGDTFGAPKGTVFEERQAEMDRLRQEAREISSKAPGPRGVALEPPRVVSVTAQGGSVSSSESAPSSVEEDNMLLLSSLRSIAAASDAAQKFRSRERMELEKLKNRPLFESSKIRILFADRKALEIIVSSGESVRGLYRITSTCVKPKVDPVSWSLTIAPPPRTLDRSSNRTMTEEGFVPSVSLRFILNGKQCNSFDVLVPELIV
jgi:hypothetical protein